MKPFKSKFGSEKNHRYLTIITVIFLLMTSAIFVYLFATLGNPMISKLMNLFAVLYITVTVTLLVLYYTTFHKSLKILKYRLLHMIHDDNDDIPDESKFLSPYTQYDKILNEIEEIIQQQYSEQLTLRHAELFALQNQINPHFLYNTLESIRGQALYEGNNNIAVLVKSLSNLFKYCTDQDRDMIALEAEFAHMDDYLLIQQFRFNNSINVIKNIENQTLSYVVPRLTIQPIVENAIHHGLEMKAGERTLTISSYSTQNRVIVRVEDNGVGMDENCLDNLNQILANDAEIASLHMGKHDFGIGLLNINRRIRLYFGSNYGLSVFSTKNLGTTIEITLPRQPVNKSSDNDKRNNEIIWMNNISKSFSGQKILENIQFYLLKGEIVSLVGLNGSAKTTLMRILCGMLQPDSGTIFVYGSRRAIASLEEGHELGIYYLDRNPMLISNMSIADNLFLGCEIGKSGIYRKHETLKQARIQLELVGLDVEPDRLVRDIPRGQQLMVQLAKALLHNVKVLIVDELGDMLTENENISFQRAMCRLRDKGLSVVMITHSINDALCISDRVAVLRENSMVGMFEKEKCSKEMIENLVFGNQKRLRLRVAYSEENSQNIPPVLLKVEHISRSQIIKDINFTIYKQERLGLFCKNRLVLEELFKILSGLKRDYGGTLFWQGDPLHLKSIQESQEVGIACVPHNIHKRAIFWNLNCREHISLTASKNFICKVSVEQQLSSNWMKKMKIGTEYIESPGNILSDGMQVRMILAKCLAAKPKLIVLDEILNVKSFILANKLLNEYLVQGMGVIFMSSNMDDIYYLCDRVLTIENGVLFETTSS